MVRFGLNLKRTDDTDDESSVEDGEIVEDRRPTSNVLTRFMPHSRRYYNQQHYSDEDSFNDGNRSYSSAHSYSGGDDMDIDGSGSSSYTGGGDNSAEYNDRSSSEEEYNTDTHILAKSTSDRRPIVQHHYHIYYNGDQNAPPKERRISICCMSSGTLWIVTMYIVFLSYILQNYGPPLPPPSVGSNKIVFNSWSEWAQHEMKTIGHLGYVLGIQVPSHVAKWCWNGIQTTSGSSTDYWQSSELDSGTECLIDRQDSATMRNWIEIYLRRNVLGQNIAISLVADAMSKWWGESSTEERPPLFLYLSGATGVGKTFLAEQIDDLIACKRNVGIVSDTPITINTTLGDDASTIYKKVTNALLPTDSFHTVIIEHAENLTTHVLITLCNLMKSNKLRDIIVVFESNVGTQLLDKAIVKSVNDNIIMSPQELQAVLSYQVGQEHDKKANRAESSQKIISTMEETITSTMDSIIPMIRLDQEAIAGLIPSAVRETWQRLSNQDFSSVPQIVFVTERLVTAVLNHLEWQSWQHRITQATIYTFLSDGGHALGPVINPLVEKTLLMLEIHNMNTANNDKEPTKLKREIVIDWDLQISGPRLFECWYPAVPRNGDNDSLLLIPSQSTHCEELQ